MDEPTQDEMLRREYEMNPPKEGSCSGIAAGMAACMRQCYKCFLHDYATQSTQPDKESTSGEDG
jgi:hypothetical protein